jgi:hypothetical protein
MSTKTRFVYEGTVACWDIVRVSKRVGKNLFVSGRRSVRAALLLGRRSTLLPI